MIRYLNLFTSFLLIVLVGLTACRDEPDPALSTAAPSAVAVSPTKSSAPAAESAIPATATAEATATVEPTATAEATTATDPSPTVTIEPLTPTATPVPTLEPVEGEPTEIVRDFLDGFMREDDTAELARYLDTELRAEIAAGETVASLLGVGEPYPSFALNLVDDGSRDGEAAVRAGLNYADTVYLRFLLTRHENDSWYISTIEPTEPPAGAGDPGEVVNEFLTSLLYDSSGSSSLPYLTARLRQEVAGGRSVLQLLGVDRVYNTYRYTIVNDGRRTGTATVEATLDYAAGPVTAIFTLVEEAGIWRISQVSRG